jgi:hypothetical protein
MAEAREAAAASRFENPVLNGQQLYCINIGERMRRIYDGRGLVTGDRNYHRKFRYSNSSEFGF